MSSSDKVSSSSLEPFSERLDVSEEMKEYQLQIKYSNRYQTRTHEYRYFPMAQDRHVILPKPFYQSYVNSKFKSRLLRDDEWRYIGICQSLGYAFDLLT